jgi:hypothetical protein
MDSCRVTITQVADRIVAPQDTIVFDALQAETQAGAAVVDRLGSVVEAAVVRYVVGDSSIASVMSDGQVRALANGVTELTASDGNLTLTVGVRVSQKPVRVVVSSDTVRFVALGETQAISGTAVDSLGYPVLGSATALAVEDTTVLELIDSVTVRSRRNGQTIIRFDVAELPVQLVGMVSQVADSVLVERTDGGPILSQWKDSVLPLRCAVLDRNGVQMAATAVVSAALGGHWEGGECRSLRLVHSGFDTLVARYGQLVTRMPLILAVRPAVSTPAGEFLQVDSLPDGTFPWAPTAYQTGSGATILYFTAYASAPSVPEHILGDLHQLISEDGLHFQYDGVVLSRDSTQCSLEGSGIENVAIVPRADLFGWRMFYSAGSFGCYGWQVFSAVSSDGRIWTKESGVRLGNGGPLPPDPPVTPPYPVGEGMHVEQLPSGQYRMIVGAFEHVQPPPENLWQITEWRSSDQLNWEYVGPVVTTRQLPAEGQGSVYSPAITQFVPGLWRMVFTADARGTTGSRSALWTAVSSDEATWHVEGQLLGRPTTDLYYATLSGGRIYFIRRDAGAGFRLAVSTVVMP